MRIAGERGLVQLAADPCFNGEILLTMLREGRESRALSAVNLDDLRWPLFTSTAVGMRECHVVLRRTMPCVENERDGSPDGQRRRAVFSGLRTQRMQPVQGCGEGGWGPRVVAARQPWAM